jgi:HlyD family secretion protein
MKAVALTASRPARWPLWLVAAPVVVLVVLGGGWLLVRNLLASSGASIDGGVYYTVRPMDLDVTIEKAGELQSANNIEIVSRVEGQTTIQSLVKEGTWVKQGDILCVLDSANIRQRIDEVSLDVQRAEADLANSRELAAIQELQNAANIELAESELRLAKIALEQYTEGTYPQQKKDAETDLKWAKIQLTNKQEDLAQTISLYEKGFVTAADVKKAELEVTTAQNAVSKAENTLHVLVNYSNKMDLASKQTAVVQAEQRLVRVKREASSAMAQRTADLKAREQAYNLQVRKLKQLQEQLEACTVRAPEDGLVVYASSGERNAQVQIQEGAQIRERQPIFRLPDTSEMKVTIRVSESQVTKLRVGQRASVNIVGVPEAVNATVEKIAAVLESGSEGISGGTEAVAHAAEPQARHDRAGDDLH